MTPTPSQDPPIPQGGGGLMLWPWPWQGGWGGGPGTWNIYIYIYLYIYFTYTICFDVSTTLTQQPDLEVFPHFLNSLLQYVYDGNSPTVGVVQTWKMPRVIQAAASTMCFRGGENWLILTFGRRWIYFLEIWSYGYPRQKKVPSAVISWALVGSFRAWNVGIPT